MEHPPLKRHESLQPLSRDHYVGLVQARHLSLAADDEPLERLAILTEFVREWNAQMEHHLADEERLLLRLLRGTVEASRLLHEHAQLRRLAIEAGHLVEKAEPPHPQWLRELGALLHDHIRWEERELFPHIEQSADAADLAELARQTQIIEDQRPRWLRARGEHVVVVDESPASPADCKNQGACCECRCSQ